MSDDIRTTRIAGGTALQHLGDPVLTFGFKDNGASEAGLDVCAGLMQANDSIRNLQLGEGVEEIAYVDPSTLDTDTLTVYVPNIIEGDTVEERVRAFYDRALGLAGDALPDRYDVEFVDATLAIPDEQVLDEKTRYGDWETGVVEQPPVDEDDIWSRELLSYLAVDLPDDAVPVDFEHVEAGADSFYLDRIDFEVNVESGATTVYRGGEELFAGRFDEAMRYMEEDVTDDAYTFDEDDDFEYGDPFNVKSGAAVQGLPDVTVHASIRDYLPA